MIDMWEHRLELDAYAMHADELEEAGQYESAARCRLYGQMISWFTQAIILAADKRPLTRYSPTLYFKRGFADGSVGEVHRTGARVVIMSFWQEDNATIPQMRRGDLYDWRITQDIPKNYALGRAFDLVVRKRVNSQPGKSRLSYDIR